MNTSYDQSSFEEYAYEWAKSKMLDLDKYYKSQIPDDELRYKFMLGLAYSYNEENPVMNEEIKKSPFRDIHYYFLMDDFESIENLCQKSINEDDGMHAYENMYNYEDSY